jgi:hypothetical protein
MRRATPATPALLIPILFSCSIAGAQSAEDLRPGTIVKTVAAKAEPAQTYALYLPSSYDPHRRWPVLYAFDPLARGSLPVECFRDAAEK